MKMKVGSKMPKGSGKLKIEGGFKDEGMKSGGKKMATKK